MIAFALAATLAVTGPTVYSLDEALAYALAHQPQLRQAGETKAAAEARVAQARSAYLPQLNAALSYQHNSSDFFSLGGGGANTGVLDSTGSLGTSAFGSRNRYAGSLGLNQLLWDFGQTTGRIGSARAGARAQDANERSTANQTAYDVRAAFFQVQATQALWNSAKDALANQERHAAQIQAYVEVGKRPQIDLAQARSELATARVQAINAENNFQNAKEQLRVAMGLEPGVAFEIGAGEMPAVEGEASDVTPLIAGAAERRPDIAALDEQYRAQEVATRAFRRAYLPTLDGSARLTDSGPTPNDLSWNWSAGVSLNWDLFKGGLTQAQVAEARHQTAALASQKTALRQKAAAEVTQAWLAIRAAKSGLAAADEAVTNARERLRLAEGRYVEGLGNAVELGDAQSAVVAAEAQAIQAHFQLALARAQLRRAIGER